MKIAISTEGDYVSTHFGRCPEFTILEIRDNKLVNRETIDNPGHGPGFLPQFLGERNVSYIVSGGMGERARELFVNENIKTILGIEGRVDDIIDIILKGTLEGGENICKPGSGRGYGVEKTECDHD
jgi:predicted Fe-Mo cluster-binding NifX family protein